jgi:hypothetical protein
MKRNLSKTNQRNLKINGLWKNRILNDCKNQDVFLAVRDNIVDFYHKGGRLFCFECNDFKTHIKYAAVIPKAGKDYLTESQLSGYKLAHQFGRNYDRIKENCKNYSGLEAAGVSELYHQYSYLSGNNIVVLDIEASFKSFNQDPNKKQDRIDIVLFNKDTQTLKFVEAKHFSNPELWYKGGTKVISQIKRYNNQIKRRKRSIISEYTKYIQILNSVFSLSLPDPLDIKDETTLLIFGFDDDQKKGRLKTSIIKNIKFSGMKVYSKGHIKSIVPKNLWNAKVL